MSNQQLKINNVYQIYQLYCKFLQTEMGDKSNNEIAKIKTALIRYTLPGYGISTQLMESHQKEKSLKKISISQFKNVLVVQQQVFEVLGTEVTIHSQRTYRSALKKMLKWCAKQNWWANDSGSAESSVLPPKRSQSDFSSVRVTSRKWRPPYALTDAEIEQASRLQKESNSDDGSARDS
jgi:hypothetical protein